MGLSFDHEIIGDYISKVRIRSETTDVSSKHHPLLPSVYLVISISLALYFLGSATFSVHVMADENSRVIQAAIDAAANLTPTPTTTDQSDATGITSEGDMDYEPASEEDGESERREFLEQLLASEGDEEEEEEEDGTA